MWIRVDDTVRVLAGDDSGAQGKVLRVDRRAGKVVVELKAVDELHPVHEAQLLTYLKLTGCRVGLLINFNVPLLKDGIERRVL